MNQELLHYLEGARWNTQMALSSLRGSKDDESRVTLSRILRTLEAEIEDRQTVKITVIGDNDGSI